MKDDDKTILIVEGNSERELLELLLPERILSNSKFIVGSGFSSVVSMAKSLLIQRPVSIVLILDADSTNPGEVRQKENRLRDIFSSIGKEDAVKVFFFVPEIETIFFEDPALREELIGRLFEKPFSGEFFSPKSVLKELFPTPTELAEWLKPATINRLRETSSLKELTTLVEATNGLPQGL